MFIWPFAYFPHYYIVFAFEPKYVTIQYRHSFIRQLADFMGKAM